MISFQQACLLLSIYSCNGCLLSQKDHSFQQKDLLGKTIFLLASELFSIIADFLLFLSRHSSRNGKIAQFLYHPDLRLLSKENQLNMNQKLISVLVGGIVNIVLGSSYFLLVVFYGVSILQITPEKIGIPVLIGALIFALLFPMFGGLTSFFWLFKKSSGAIKIFDAAVVGALSGILCAIALIIFLFNDARKSHQDMDVSLCALIVVWFAVTSLVGASIGAFFYRNHKSKAKAAAGY